MMQQTFLKSQTCQGIGLHNGQPVKILFKPAPVNTGIVFVRSDLKENNVIPALFDKVIDTSFCTVVANEHGARVSTIEHLMAALWERGIDNAFIEIDSAEVPIIDGSAYPFIELIDSANIARQPAKRKIIKILQTITISQDDKSVTMRPGSHLSIDFTIDFAQPHIGRQSHLFDSAKDNFSESVSKARTFGFMHDLDMLKSRGLAQGASLENAIGIDVTEGRILNEEGLRYPDEFVRHKVLDCIGDLYLAGWRIKGHILAVKSGHTLNNQLLKKLFASPDCYCIAESTI